MWCKSHYGRTLLLVAIKMSIAIAQTPTSLPPAGASISGSDEEDEEQMYAELSAFGGRPEGGPEDGFQMYYTSGTTGRPKGVLLSHRVVVLHAIGTILGEWFHKKQSVCCAVCMQGVECRCCRTHGDYGLRNQVCQVELNTQAGRFQLLCWHVCTSPLQHPAMRASLQDLRHSHAAPTRLL
jgi:acyl-CoA synthetase (AMP-forming)/AMP-acid ligase II